MQTLILILWNLYGLEAFPTENVREKIITPDIVGTNVTTNESSSQSQSIVTPMVTSSDKTKNILGQNQVRNSLEIGVVIQ